jgi:hypothetical protein
VETTRRKNTYACTGKKRRGIGRETHKVHLSRGHVTVQPKIPAPYQETEGERERKREREREIPVII